MVLGRSNKNSLANEGRPQEQSAPPPPYKESDFVPPVVLAETRTTTRTEIVTTTTQTTHFFSLGPLFRKRPVTASSSTRPSLTGSGDIGPVNNGQRTTSYMIEKDLPPTPAMSQETERDVDEEGRQSSQMIHEGGDVAAPDIVLAPSSPNNRPPPKQSRLPVGAALAQASLGLGLTNFVPQAPSSSSSSHESGTIAFVSATDTPLPLNDPRMRRVKSSQKLRTSLAAGDTDTRGRFSLDGDKRRSRVASMGPAISQSSDKGKAKETDDKVVGQSLTRRPSFWSRKKKELSAPSRPTTADSTKPPLPDQLSTSSNKPSLPSVIPVSPLNIDVAAASTSLSSTSLRDKPRSPMISRSLSARTSSYSSSPLPLDQTFTQTMPSPRRSPTSPNYRPATADSSSRPSPRSKSFRPTTSDGSGRSPTRFFSSDNTFPRPEASQIQPSLTLPSEGTQTQEALPPSPTSRRPRAQTNPPLLHRLSVNLFSSSGPLSTTKTSGIFGPNMFTTSSPVADGSKDSSPRPSTSKKPVDVPKPQVDDESPETYLERLLTIVSKAEIAGVLASSGDAFYVRALRSYIERFEFKNDPLDVALRKLLMEVGLPRETQQIDRVVEAFAAQYVQSNPNLFASDDHPYILAFSLIMLHTDAFNKSNKRKMTKPDYVKNTRLPGVAPEVLDCFFDNIVFAPFIFIEDPLDVNGQRGLMPESASTQTLSKPSSSNPSPVNGSSTTLLGKGKVDPYYLITHNLLDPLRVPVERFVPFESPYSYKGTGELWDDEDLHNAFARAALIEVGAVDSYKASSPFFGLSVGGLPSPMTTMGAMPDIYPETGEIWTLKVTKVGLLNRKDDILEGGKKAINRKWKTWSIILTGSQLLLFRDPSWATALLRQSDSSDGQILLPQVPLFRPDELLSVKDAIAVYDKSYVKYEHTIRLVIPDGRQLLLRASDEREMDEWISRINYASAFKSAGVRMRALGMSGKDVELTGVAAATSHLHDMQHHKRPAHKVHSWDGEAAHDLMEMLSGSSEPLGKNQKAAPNRRLTMMANQNDMDLDVAIAPEIEGAHQFKVTFDQVKAELAAANWSSSEDSSEVEDPPRSRSLDISAPTRSLPTRSDSLPLPSRSQIIQTKIRDLESRITATQASLDTDLRFVRNVATLTPFQKATRDRLQVAVQSISKRVSQMRLDLTRLICHRDVLASDLVAEKRDFHKAKDLAFRAATETLQSRRGKPVPQMTLSFHDQDKSLSPNPPTNNSDVASHRPESSVADSFHSALDFGPEWPSSDDIGSSTFLDTSRTFDSPCPSSPVTPAATHLSSDSFPFPDPDQQSGPTPPTSASRPAHSPVVVSHERFYTAPDSQEEAEEWDKTRAAKRVSLVRVPSDIRMTNRYARHSRQEDIEEDSIR